MENMNGLGKFADKLKNFRNHIHIKTEMNIKGGNKND